MRKRTIAIAFILTMLVSFSSCGEKGLMPVTSESETTTFQNVLSTASATEPPSETMDVTDLDLTPTNSNVTTTSFVTNPTVLPEVVPDTISFTPYYHSVNWVPSEDLPKTLWVTNLSELEQFYQTDGNGIQPPKQYDETFFKSHNLILVTLQESSGSTRHEVVDLHLSAEENGFSLCPEIVRTISSVSTCDMAQWNIFMEISKDFNPTNTVLKLANIHN